MKHVALLFFLVPLIFAQDGKPAGVPRYFFVLMDTGPTYDSSKPPSGQKDFPGHAAYMEKLEKAGVIFGGPLLEIENEGKVAGAMMIFAATDVNQVRSFLKDEPLMQNGVLKLNAIKRFVPAVKGLDFSKPKAQ